MLLLFIQSNESFNFKYIYIQCLLIVLELLLSPLVLWALG